MKNQTINLSHFFGAIPCYTSTPERNVSGLGTDGSDVSHRDLAGSIQFTRCFFCLFFYFVVFKVCVCFLKFFFFFFLVCVSF